MNLNDPTIQMFLPLIMMGAIFYFLVWRPQSQRTKQLRAMINNLKRGDTVVMASGMVGRVAKTAAADDQEILVEIADNVQVRVVKATLTDVRVKGDAAEKA
jgi:preprotein translocase subunit YajC